MSAIYSIKKGVKARIVKAVYLCCVPKLLVTWQPSEFNRHATGHGPSTAASTRLVHAVHPSCRSGGACRGGGRTGTLPLSKPRVRQEFNIILVRLRAAGRGLRHCRPAQYPVGRISTFGRASTLYRDSTSLVGLNFLQDINVLQDFNTT